MYQLLFCLTGSQKTNNKPTKKHQWESVCVHVCVLDRERKMVLASRALVVVSIDGSESGYSDWYSWSTFDTL